MKYTIGFIDKEEKESSKIIIKIGENKYRLSESDDGRLTINKTTDGIIDTLAVYPRCSNEVDLV